MPVTHPLAELLRDDSEIADLLSAYGEAVDDATPRALRARLLKLVENLGEERLLTTLFEFARGFARMSQDIMAFCEAKGVAIAGQIQVKTEDVFLEKTALNSGWAFTGAPSAVSGTQERAAAIAATIMGILEGLTAGDLLRSGTERQETPFGRSLRGSPEREVLREILKDSAYRTVHYQEFSDADIKALSEVRDLLADGAATLAPSPAVDSVAAALTDLESRCELLIAEILSEGRPSEGEVNPIIAALADQIAVLTGQARQLAEDEAEARRVDEGFADFLRTEFWFQRWRVYELWLLTRMMQALEGEGGEVKLGGVENGCWTVRYGRASEPVASCSFPEGVVDVYYQLFEEGADRADMPDIALVTRGGPALLVLDPKHGRSYNRSRVQEVLNRYARHFKADITAVVNYFPMPAYKFESVPAGSRRWILASDVAPGSANVRRIELNLADALLARGLGPRTRTAERPVRETRQAPARAACVLYWAKEATEVDEPAGPWCAPEGGRPVPLPKLLEFVTRSLGEGAGSARGIAPAPDGDSCVLWSDKAAYLLRRGSTPARLTVEAGEYLGWLSDIQWDSQGSRFFITGGKSVVVFDAEGNSVPASEYERYGVTYVWSADGLYLARVTEARWGEPATFAVSHDFGDWRPVDRVEVDRSAPGFPVLAYAGPDGPIRFTARRHVLLKARTVDVPEMDGIVGFSPSGRYRIAEGPASRRRDEGVMLLAVVDQDHPAETLPYIRFFGKVGGEAGGALRWSSDESRFAFLSSAYAGNERTNRLLMARPGDRHAVRISLPGQEPSFFAWLNYALLKPYMP